MAQLNKVLLIGNLTRDPEVRYTPKGFAVADIGLATNRTWLSDTGEKKEEVCYVNIVVWGKQAEAAGKYLKKGRSVFVEGRLQFESWEKNGEKRTTLKVNCERLQFLGSPGGRGAESEAPPPEEPASPPPPASTAPSSSSGPAPAAKGGSEPDLENDDIPF